MSLITHIYNLSRRQVGGDKTVFDKKVRGVWLLVDFIIIGMNILSSEEMREAEQQLLKTDLPPHLRLRLPSVSQPAGYIALIPLAPEPIQLDIKKVVSLAGTISSLPLSDPNSTLKVFTVAILSILYQSRYRSSVIADHSLLQAIKCSLFSPAVNLSSIKGSPSSCSSSYMKTAAALFFAFMTEQQDNFAAESFHTASLILHNNEHLLNCFLLFFRCVLQAIEVEGAGSQRTAPEQTAAIENLLDYFDLSYRQIGDLFLLYEQGLFLSVTQREIVYGEYFENEREKEEELKQLELKSSVKKNMVESLLLRQEDRGKKKNGIVDSDLKLFNFMLESSQEDQEEKLTVLADSETPHFKENEQFNFGKRKKEEQAALAYRPEEVRFQFQKLIQDESMEEIEADDLINFHAQFDEAPTPFLGGQFQFKPETTAFENPNQRSTTAKNAMAESSASFDGEKSKTVNRAKKATTEMSPRDDHKVHNLSELHSCFCREVRLSRNICVSKVVDYSFVPLNPARRQFFNPSIPPKNAGFKGNPRTPTEGKSYTLNKESAYKEKKSQIIEERTPAFLKNIKKQNSKNMLRTETDIQEFHPASAQEIGRERPAEEMAAKKQTSMQEQLEYQPRRRPRDDEALTKMKFSDNQQASGKKFEMPSRVLGQSSNWQTSSNFHQRQPTNASILNQAKSAFLQQSIQPKNISPLKFFAPVQIIAPTVYLSSNGNEASNNILFKVPDMQEQSPKRLRAPPISPFSSSAKAENAGSNALIK